MKTDYTINGKKNTLGILQCKTSLKAIISNCTDFEEEETMLQAMGRSMGVIINRSPKCHPKLAGEGVEYSWGCAKNAYHHLALREKKKKDNFLISVRKCLSRETLPNDHVRAFSKHAREYICLYHFIWQEKQQRMEQDENNTTAVQMMNDDPATSSYHDLTTTPVKIEKMVKLFKTHRCALDFDHAFCKAQFTER